MDCPECNKLLEISEEEDVYSFLSETGIAGIIAAIILIPIFSYSIIFGFIIGVIIFFAIAYLTYLNSKANQLYRCYTCNKSFRGDKLREVGNSNDI